MKICYVGLQLPRVTWTALMEYVPVKLINSVDVGEIYIEAEFTEQGIQVERYLLDIAMMNGAHMVLIEAENVCMIVEANDYLFYSLYIHAKCCRFNS